MSAQPQTFHQFWCLNYWSGLITFFGEQYVIYVPDK
jgi:hypothetical protein